jgi:hypothetical protein
VGATVVHVPVTLDKPSQNTVITHVRVFDGHGRTQIGNGETGYYGTVDMGGFERTPDGLVLASRRLDKPDDDGSGAMVLRSLKVWRAE